MTKLLLTNVSKEYTRGQAALTPVGLAVHAGEFLVLVGPSGCGKSTLLRLIAGLEEPTTGQITLDGRDITHTPAKDRDMAMVFQNYALYPHLTVRENIAFPLRMRQVPRPAIAAAVQTAAEQLGLSPLLDRLPAQLSGGQRQRVALGRAIVRRPSIFLFDEPLSNLDASLRAATRAELVRLHRRLGATTLYVTHDQVEAMSMADRLVVLRDGTVQQVGTPLDVYRRPANRFVAGFIGSPPMNLLPATPAPSGPHLLLADYRLPLPGPVPLPRAVLVGLRAEDVRLAAPGQGLPATVQHVEALGHEVLLTCSLAGGHELLARLGPHRPPRAGDRLSLLLDLSRAVLFDAATGAALSMSTSDPSAPDPAQRNAATTETAPAPAAPKPASRP